MNLKLETYLIENTNIVNTSINESIKDIKLLPNEVLIKGYLVGLTNLYKDIENDLIYLYENNFNDKDTLNIIKLKINDMSKYIDKLSK